MHATASYSNGTSADVTASSLWQANFPNITVTQGGVVSVTGAGNGYAEVFATFGGLQGGATVLIH
jgi:hypothetical protein